jgi:hypothetical protein
MAKISLLVATTACAVVPLSASAQTAPGQGQYKGAGYSHMNSGTAAGQPSQDCLDLIMNGEGAFPGNSSSSPGAPFNEVNGKSGAMYAGSQPQNSRNTASVSQYDIACANQAK